MFTSSLLPFHATAFGTYGSALCAQETCCPLLAIQSLHTWWAHRLEVYVPNVPMFHECPTQPQRAFRGCNRGSCLPFEALFLLHRNLERPHRMSFPYSRPAPTRRWNQGLIHPDRKAADHHRSVRE